MSRTSTIAIYSELRCEEEPDESPSLFTDMPEDIFYIILGQLRSKDVANLIATCRRFYSQASRIWAYHIQSLYKVFSADLKLPSNPNDIFSWRDIAHILYLRDLEHSQLPTCDYLQEVQNRPWPRDYRPRLGLMHEDRCRHINGSMRAVLVGWVIEVVDGWLQPRSVLHLTVRYIDIYLSCYQVPPSYLQLIGIMALRIAADHFFNTVREVFVPSVKECIWISDDIFEVKEAVEIEKSIRSVISKFLKIENTLGRVKFGGDTIGLRSYLETPWAITSTCCRSWFLLPSEVDSNVDFLASFLTEIALLCYEILHVQPSLVAASSVTLARICLGKFYGLPGTVRAVGLRNRHPPCFFDYQVIACCEMLLVIWRNYYESFQDIASPQYFTFTRFGRRHMQMISEIRPPDDEALDICRMKSPCSPRVLLEARSPLPEESK